MQQPQQQQPMMEHQREPCPDRILDDIGGAFAMGAVGGGAWHLVKGLKNSPSGFRVRGALEVRRWSDGRGRKALPLPSFPSNEACPNTGRAFMVYCGRNEMLSMRGDRGEV